MENWTLGLSLTVLTIAIHATSVVFMALALRHIRIQVAGRGLRLRYDLIILISAICLVGFMLALLHGIEAALWARVYLMVGALASPEEAILYSIDTMTTRGASGLMVQQHWRILGVLEAADGVILFGISTAFIFTVIQQGLTRILDSRHHS